MSGARRLDFYFDFISPYAYFAWRNVLGLCSELSLELTARPVVFGKLLDHWGQLGPAEIPPKRDWLFRFCYRYARIRSWEFNPPKYHPFNPLPALRLALPEVSGAQQQQLITAIFEAGWAQGRDISDIDELITILEAAQLPGAVWSQELAKPAVKTALIHATAAAIERGIFGVPTMLIDDQLFWGNDQFEHLRLYILGEDPLDEQAVRRAQQQQRGIDRRKLKKR